jgi:uroporphyrin-III C-methyltransferase
VNTVDSNRSDSNASSAPPNRAQSYTPRGFKSWLAAIAALILLGFSGYALLKPLFNPAGPADPNTPATSTTATPQNSDIESLKARFSDAQKVNALLREQSLALTQRLSLVEDALQNMSRGMAPAASTLKLDEADFLMSLAQIRLDLFNDVEHAQRAMELADSQLAGVNDPKLARIRQTIAIELDALRAVPRIDAAGISTKLTALRIQIDKLPVQIGETGSGGGRIARLLDRYLVVRREGEAMPVVGRSAWAVREGLKIEIERAQLALERRASGTFDDALQTADTLAKQALQADDAQVMAFFAELNNVRSNRINAQMPNLGAALTELRSVRGGTRAAVLPDQAPEEPAKFDINTQESAEPLLPIPEQNPIPPQIQTVPETAPSDAPAMPTPPADAEVAPTPLVQPPTLAQTPL